MLKKIVTFLGWALASLLLWVGTVALIKEKLNMMVAVVIIIWGILCLPPLFVFTKKYGWMWNFCVRVMLFILVPVVLSPFISIEELSSSVGDLDLFPSRSSPTVTTSPSSTPSVSPNAASPAPSPLSQSPLPILKPRELQNGQTYGVAEATPLMTAHSPTNTVTDLQQMKIVPKGGVFQITEIFTKNNIPWYKVKAFDDEKKPIGVGWISSTTLTASQPIAAQPTPTLTVSPAGVPSILPSPSVTILLPSPSVSKPKPVASSPAPKPTIAKSAASTRSSPLASTKPVISPSPSQSSKSRWPSHQVLTEGIPGGGTRIVIETDDPTISREQCFALVNKYLAQAQGNGQVIVYKPNANPPWNGRVLAFCLNDLDRRGTRINDVYDW